MNDKKLIYKTQMKEAIMEIAGIDLSMSEKIERKYRELLNENDLSDKMLAIHLKKSILPSIAVYEILMDNGFKSEGVFEIIRSSVLHEFKKNQKIFQRIGKIPFGYSLIKIMTPVSIKLNFGESGWDFEWKRKDKYAMEWDCHRCFYVDIFTKYSVPELTSIFCESDDFVYGDIPNVIWGRSKTIGNGDSICDFKFFNAKRKGQGILE